MIYVINCVNIPEDSCCEMTLHLEGIASGAHYVSVQLGLPFKASETSNRFCCKPHAFSGCRCTRIHFTSSGLSCRRTPVRLACSRQNTQLAWLAGTGAQDGASCMHTPAIHCQQELSVRSSAVAPPTLSTASEALDPGEQRLFLLADQPENRPIRRSQNMKGICKV